MTITCLCVLYSLYALNERLEVLVAVKTEFMVFWVVAPRSVMAVHRRF